MVKIAPSILSADFCNLERDINRIRTADMVHVDVMDGAFVPNITIGVPVVKSIRSHTDMFLDVHLMIDKPVRYIEQFCKAGADLLSIHLEADHPTRIAEALRKMEECKVKKAVALWILLKICTPFVILAVHPLFQFALTNRSKECCLKNC